MTGLPHPWAAYARLQEELDKSNVSGRSWGLEAALNQLLAQPQELPTATDCERVVQNASRQERHRARLRRVWTNPEAPSPGLESMVDARRRLRLVQARVTGQNWAVLSALGEGYDYGEIAAGSGIAEGALRARVCRLRRFLQKS